MTRRVANDPIALARRLLESLGQQADPDAANDEIDEDAIRDLARRDAEEMRRARKR